MSTKLIPCHFCDANIPQEDFENGRAVILLKKNYCAKCMAEAVKRSKRKNAPPSPVFQTPPPEVAGPLQSRRSRRRHERKDCSIPVELSVYLENGQLYDRGEAVLWNLSLSGALLRALILPARALPAEPHHIGIRVQQGDLRNFTILGRPVRMVHSEDGLHLAIEFVRTDSSRIEQLLRLAT